MAKQRMGVTDPDALYPESTIYSELPPRSTSGVVDQSTLYPRTKTVGTGDGEFTQEYTDVTKYRTATATNALRGTPLTGRPYTLNEYVDLLDADETLIRGTNLTRKPVNTLKDAFKKDSDVPVLDEDWARSRFMSPGPDLATKDQISRFQSTANWKFESTGWGQHSVINPYPQFTRYADIRRSIVNDGMKGIAVHNKLADERNFGGTKNFAWDLGMGRYYSEAIDDNMQQVYMQFGTPEFNSILGFFTMASYYEDTYIATHGRYPIEFSIASGIAGFGLLFAHPFVSLFMFLVKSAYKIYVGFKPFSFYYLNPNMHMYWGNVNSIVTSMAVELGMLSPILDDDATVQKGEGKSESMKEKLMEKSRNQQLIGYPVKFNQDDMDDLRKYLPDIIGPKTNYIDIYRLATAHTRRVTRIRQLIINKLEMYMEANATNPLSKAEEDIHAYLMSGYMDNERLTNLDTSHLKDVKQLVTSTVLAKSNDTNFTLHGMLAKLFAPNGETIFDIGIAELKEHVGPYLGKDNTGKDAVVEAVKNIRNVELISNHFIGTDKYSETLKLGGFLPSEETDEEKKAREEKEQANLTKNNVDDLRKGSDRDEDGIPKLSNRENDPHLTRADATGGMVAALIRDGGMFAGFRVDYTGPASDSFSNSTGPMEVANAYKSAVGTMHNFSFSLAGGNLVPGMGAVFDVVKKIGLGALDGATFGLSSVVASALSGAFVDFPEKWEESSTNLYSANYSMTLVAPYGNMISQLQNIYIPLAMLLAGALPMSVGKSSHTSPMICNLFCKGVQNIDLGIITDISITRGTSNQPFDSWRRPLAMEVTFTVKDLAPIVSVPINKNTWTNILNLSDVPPNLMSEGGLDRYLGVMCARDLHGFRFYGPQFWRKLRKASMRVSQITNADAYAFRAGELLNMFSGLFVRDLQLSPTQSNTY